VLPLADAKTSIIVGGVGMNLIIWLPALFLLGVVVLAVLYAFIYGCERV
jgi:hypothetical protein